MSLLLIFWLFTFPRCMEECVELRDWCVKHPCWILMRESVSVGTLFLNARNCFLRLRVDPSPCLRASFGCWLLEMFQMKPRYDVKYYGADLFVLLVMGTLFWQGCNWPQILVLCSIHHHHHRVLLLLVEHRASTKSFQVLWSPTLPLTSFHDLPVFLISPSIVLRQVFFSLPLLLYPWGFQSNGIFSIAPASLRNVCPIQFHFLLFIWISIGFCLVILHSSLFVILSVHFIFIIYLKHLFVNVCSITDWKKNVISHILR